MIKYQNDFIGQNTGSYKQLHQNQSNSVVMEAIEMTFRDIGNMGDGVRPGRVTVSHSYRKSIYIILVSKNDTDFLIEFTHSIMRFCTIEILYGRNSTRFNLFVP